MFTDDNSFPMHTLYYTATLWLCRSCIFHSLQISSVNYVSLWGNLQLHLQLHLLIWQLWTKNKHLASKLFTKWCCRLVRNVIFLTDVFAACQISSYSPWMLLIIINCWVWITYDKQHTSHDVLQIRWQYESCPVRDIMLSLKLTKLTDMGITIEGAWTSHRNASDRNNSSIESSPW